jgi:ATP-binding cassette subfamily F protein 3
VLGAFLFHGEDVFKPVAALSGGEKSRLALAKLLLNPPNFLLLDEPTTHLDIQSVDTLVAALRQYDGTMVFVSHDLYLIQQLATSVLYLDGERVRFYPGGYEYFQDRFAAGQSEAEGARGKPDTAEIPVSRGVRATEKERRRQEAEARQERSRRRKALEGQLTRLEAEILELEDRQKALIDRLQAADAGPAAMELAQVTSSLKQLTAQWDELAEAIQGV